MKRYWINRLVLSSMVAMCFLASCSSPEDKAKKEITRILTENSKGTVSNIQIETYQGLFPIVFDKNIIEKSNDYNNNVKTINSCQRLIAETNLPNPFSQDLVVRNYRRSLNDAEFEKKSNFDKIIKSYSKIESSRPTTEAIIALVEYDIDDSQTTTHKREVVAVDKNDPTKLLKAQSITPYSNKGILTAIQITKSDTVIIEPNKDEVRQIISLLEDPAIQYALRDSI